MEHCLCRFKIPGHPNSNCPHQNTSMNPSKEDRKCDGNPCEDCRQPYEACSCPCHFAAPQPTSWKELKNLLYDYGNACSLADRGNLPQNEAAQLAQGPLIEKIILLIETELTKAREEERTRSLKIVERHKIVCLEEHQIGDNLPYCSHVAFNNRTMDEISRSISDTN